MIPPLAALYAFRIGLEILGLDCFGIEIRTGIVMVMVMVHCLRVLAEWVIEYGRYWCLTRHCKGREDVGSMVEKSRTLPGSRHCSAC